MKTKQKVFNAGQPDAAGLRKEMRQSEDLDATQFRARMKQEDGQLKVQPPQGNRNRLHVRGAVKSERAKW